MSEELQEIENMENNNGTTSCDFDFWGNPELIKVEEVGESVEFIYKQNSIVTMCSDFYPMPDRTQRVYKIVYSCIDGKWNKSVPIFGTIIPKSEESYEFEE